MRLIRNELVEKMIVGAVDAFYCVYDVARKVRYVHLFCAIIIMAALWYNPKNYWLSIWYDKWLFVMIGCVVFISGWVREKLHWSIALASCFVLLNALVVFGWSPTYATQDVPTIIAIHKSALYAFAATLTMLVALVICSASSMQKVAYTFGVICLMNSAATIIEFLAGVPRAACGGLFGNPSMSGCLIAFTYPMVFLLPWKNASARETMLILFSIFAPWFAVALPGCSQPLIIMGVVAAAFAISYVRKRWMFWLSLPALWLLAGFAALFCRKPEGILLDSGRFGMYKMVISAWWKAGHIWFGQGTGTAQVLIPALESVNGDHRILLHQLPQVAHKAQIDLWFWLHSDFLQSLFENGVIGTAILLVCVGYALVFSWRKSPILFASLVGLLASAVFNFPVHFPLHSLFGVFVFVACFHSEYLVKRICENVRGEE